MTQRTLLASAFALVFGLGLTCSGPAVAQATSTAGAQGSTSSQGGAAASPSGANAAASAAGTGSAHAGDSSAALASGSAVNAVLAAPVHSGKSKPGDPVSARTTQATQTESGAQIPKGSTLIGHVTEAHARGGGIADSAVGIAFDKAVTRDGREVPLRNVGIQAVAASESAVSGSVMDGGAMAGGAGSLGGAANRGGGVVGRAAGVGGATVGTGLGAVGGAGSVTGNAGTALRGSANAVGGLNAGGMLTSNSSGVFGLDGLNLGRAAAGSAGGTLLTSSTGAVRLDRGTRLLLSSQSTSQAAAGTQPSAGATSKSPSGDQDRRDGKSDNR